MSSIAPPHPHPTIVNNTSEGGTKVDNLQPGRTLNCCLCVCLSLVNFFLSSVARSPYPTMTGILLDDATYFENNVFCCFFLCKYNINDNFAVFCYQPGLKRSRADTDRFT